MSDTVEIIIRAFVAFVMLMLICHILGKQMISQMTNYQFVAAITIGSIAGNTVFNINIQFFYFILALFIFTGIILLLTVVDMKIKASRRWISGETVLIIENGNILEENMRRLRINLDTLNQGLRGKDIFDITEVQYAFIEPNGSLSVLRKPAYRSITKQDLNLHLSPSTLPVELIIEGKILAENVTLYHLDKDWLLNELSKRNLSLSNVFYAVKSSNGKLYFDLYD